MNFLTTNTSLTRAYLFTFAEHICTTTAFYITRKTYNDFVVCAFDSSHRATIVKERIYPDLAIGHMNAVLPKLTTFWGTCILPEILGRWYSRKCNMSDEMPQAGARICFCRRPSDANTVKCGNPQCPFVDFIYLVWQFQPHFPRGGIAHTAAGSHSLSVWEK